MPDWFYRTVSRPVLFRLPAAASRDFALGFMGRLARLPLGPRLIDFLGHMGPDARLQRTRLGLRFPTAVGLGPALDARAEALPALARFGFGFLEAGPIAVKPGAGAAPIERRPEQEAVWMLDPPASLGLQEVLPRLAEASRLGLPLLVRLGLSAEAAPEQAAEEARQLIRELTPHVQLFSLPLLGPAIEQGWSDKDWAAALGSVLAAREVSTPPSAGADPKPLSPAAAAEGSNVKSAAVASRNSAPLPRRPVLLCVPANLDLEEAGPYLEAAQTAGVAGLLVDGSVRAKPAGRLVGLPAREPAIEQVRALRGLWGQDALLIGSGGIHEPEHALQMLEAGADLVQVDTGLVYTGPGLPKRINDVLLYAATRQEPLFPAPAPPQRPAEMTWFWTTLMGAGMLVGSVLALVVAATRVVLPYDESFAGLSREDFARINPRLLAFMTHDRVTLAGTMIAIGVLYLGLSRYGIRRGLHWAQTTVFASAFVGFASFFLFLGYGYLDPFHAFVTAVLLQLFLLGVHSRLGPYVPESAPALRSDRAWRLGLWGQLLLIAHGFALLAAGLTISAIGVTQVFVWEDLDFMGTTAHALASANPRLVPVVAHDRATFGGMLLASGLAMLLPALWGFRNGSAWLWWTLLLAGLPAYASALGVHFAVGYTHLTHLLPAFAGLGLFLLALALARPYLCSRAAPWAAGGPA
jgi:dihydroorotate dehydrogenase